MGYVSGGWAGDKRRMVVGGCCERFWSNQLAGEALAKVGLIVGAVGANLDFLPY